MTTRKPKGPSEAQIQKACDELLALDSWRKIVTDPPHMRGLGVSEKGIPDRLYLRYGLTPLAPLEKKDWANPLARVKAEALWCEWKRKGGKAAQHQIDWHARERARGALTLIAGQDFEATIEGLQEWYMASGLNRRMKQK